MSKEVKGWIEPTSQHPSGVEGGSPVSGQEDARQAIRKLIGPVVIQSTP
jgi:hypothetical protein